MVLAMQCDATRIITFMLGNAISGQTYPSLGITGGHHDISHHASDPTKLSQLASIGLWEITQLAYLMNKMKAVTEGSSNMLFNSTIFFSSDISDGNRHNHDDMPVILAGHGGGALTPGKHLVVPQRICAKDLQSPRDDAGYRRRRQRDDRRQHGSAGRSVRRLPVGLLGLLSAALAVACSAVLSEDGTRRLDASSNADASTTGGGTTGSGGSTSTGSGGAGAGGHAGDAGGSGVGGASAGGSGAGGGSSGNAGAGGGSSGNAGAGGSSGAGAGEKTRARLTALSLTARPVEVATEGPHAPQVVECRPRTRRPCSYAT